MQEASDTAQPQFYGPALTVFLTILVYIVAQLVGGILISSIPASLGWSEAQTSAWLSNSSWAQFLFVAIVETATLLTLRFFMKRRNIGWRTIGFNNPKAKYIVYALAGFVAYFMLYMVGLVLAKILVPSLNLEQEQQLGFDKTATGINLLPIFISLVILPPLVEEIVARGFLYTGLRNKLPVIVSAVITSILFAIAHLGGAESGLLWVAAIDTFILSMVMCVLREKSGSLWPSIGLHFIKNFIAFAVLFNIVQYFR